MELEVQKFLRNGQSLAELKWSLGIKYVEHEDGRVILNYDQIESLKTHPISIECRGLVLDSKNNWKVVAKAYDRFFNLGEHGGLTTKFNWDNFDVYTKEDGSLMLLYFHNGQWFVNTRGSFAESECNFSGKTWSELFFELLGDDLENLYISRECTYIFEFWTPFNKVVRIYPKPCIILTGIVHLLNHGSEDSEPIDLPNTVVNVEAEFIGLTRPDCHSFTSLKEVEDFLQLQEENDPTFEGVVVRDINGLRMKIKSKTYVALHRLSDNGNVYNPKNLVPFVLAGEEDELLTYFPEVESAFREVETKMNEALAELIEIGLAAKDIESQKDFALFITRENNVKFTGILFDIRKQYGFEWGIEEIQYEWRNAAPIIIKTLFK